MSTSLNWLCPGFSSPSSWQQLEIELWCQQISKILLSNVVVSCSVRMLLSIVYGGSLGNAIIGMACGVLIVMACSLMLLNTKRLWLKTILATLFLHACQAYFLSVAIFIYPEQLAMCVVGSTFLFFNYELHTTTHAITVLYLIVRQFVMWHLAQMHISHTHFTWHLPYIVVIGTFLQTLYLAYQSRSRTIERYLLFNTIEERDQRLRSILQAIPEGLAVMSAAGSLSCFNHRLPKLLGRGDVTDQEIEAILREFHCFADIKSEVSKEESLMGEMQAFLRDSSEDCRTFGVTKLGEGYLEWKGSRCRWGEVPACILTVSDISPWVALRKLAQQESDTKTTLLKFVSHELRTPTNAILNFVDDVRAAPNLTPSQKSDLSMVLSSTHFLLGVINDLLDFSRIVADKFLLVKSPFDLRSTISSCVQLVDLQCARKGIDINTKFDPLIPDIVFSDCNRLKQVMLNLLSNAVKFTFVGGIQIVCTMTERHSVRVAVSDSGIGIAESKLGDLFQCFSTVKSSEKLNPQGCGLGLVIANLIVKSLGPGCIQVTSVPGIGSCFQFELEIYQTCPTILPGCEDDTTADIPTERESVVSTQASPNISARHLPRVTLPKVLIVDDSEFNRAVLAKMLNGMEWQCEEAETGLRAINLIRSRAAGGHFYSLILMDIEMPEMDGLTATIEIRHLERIGELQARPRILACSAYSSKEDEDRCHAAGMDDYLEKPINRHRLWDIVRSI